MKKWFTKLKLNKMENTNAGSANNNDISQPKPVNKNNNDISQPSNNEIKSGFNWRKFTWILIILLIGGGLIGIIIYSIYSTGPSRVENYGIAGVSNGKVLTNDDGTPVSSAPTSDSFSIYTSKDNSTTRSITSRDTVAFYYDVSESKLRVTVGNNFSGFYFVINVSQINVTGVANPVSVYDFGNLAISTSWDSVGGATLYYPSTDNTTWSAVTDPLLNNTNNKLLLNTTFNGAKNNTSVVSSGFDWTLLINLVPIILMVIIFIFIFRSMRGSMQGGGQDNVFSIGKSQAKIAQSNVKFSDVAGIEEEKNELIEIVDYLKRPDKYVAMGARVPKGVILYGPPGTGKTLLAKAVAGEAQVPFFQVSGSAFEDMLVGVGAKRVRDLFNKAVKAAPAIIFIDEIDSVGSKRGKLETTSGSLADQTLNQLLAEMDGFSNRSGVIVMAATNRLDVLDDALLRPGRFDRHIQVNLPDIKERTAILKIHSRNKNISSSVDLEDISRRTPGFSGAQLENVLNEATLLAVRRNKNSISTEDIDEAIDRVIAGPAKKTKVISAEEKKQIAYHEAGHALVGLHIKGGDVVQKITIIPRGQAAGYTLSVPEIQELSIQKKSDLLGMVAGLLGGRASEEIVYGKDAVSTGAANDLYKVTNVVRAMVMQLGMSEVGMTQFVPSEGVANPYQQKLFSETTALSIDKEIDKIIKKQYEVAQNIIKKNKKELDLIVESLLLLETIVKPQIDYIHKNLKLPEEALAKKQELLAKKEEKIKKATATKKAEPQEVKVVDTTKKPTTSSTTKNSSAKKETKKDSKN